MGVHRTAVVESVDGNEDREDRGEHRGKERRGMADGEDDLDGVLGKWGAGSDGATEAGLQRIEPSHFYCLRPLSTRRTMCRSTGARWTEWTKFVKFGGGEIIMVNCVGCRSRKRSGRQRQGMHVARTNTGPSTIMMRTRENTPQDNTTRRISFHSELQYLTIETTTLGKGGQARVGRRHRAECGRKKGTRAW